MPTKPTMDRTTTSHYDKSKMRYETGRTRARWFCIATNENDNRTKTSTHYQPIEFKNYLNQLERSGWFVVVLDLQPEPGRPTVVYETDTDEWTDEQLRERFNYEQNEV